MSVKKLRPDIHHHTVCLFGRSSDHISTVIENLRDLQAALKGGDRRDVVESLAEVELTLPYLFLIYMKGDRFDIEFKGRCECDSAIEALISVIILYSEYTYLVSLYGALKGLTRHLCESLYGVYCDYNISFEEVDEYIIERKAQMLADKFKERKSDYLNRESKNIKPC